MTVFSQEHFHTTREEDRKAWENIILVINARMAETSVLMVGVTLTLVTLWLMPLQLSMAQTSHITQRLVLPSNSNGVSDTIKLGWIMW